MPKYEIISCSPGCGTDHSGYVLANTIFEAVNIVKRRALDEEAFRPWGDLDSVDVRGPVGECLSKEHEIVFFGKPQYNQYARTIKRRRRRTENRRKRESMKFRHPQSQGHIVTGYVVTPKEGYEALGVFTELRVAEDYLKCEIGENHGEIQHWAIIVWADGTASIFDSRQPSFKFELGDDYSSEETRKVRELQASGLQKLTPEERKALGVAPRL
jgi:hypothetical protein